MAGPGFYYAFQRAMAEVMLSHRFTRIEKRIHQMYILGINAYHGDAAAAIICDGRLIAAAEEERFNRFKHSRGISRAGDSILSRRGGHRLEDLDHVGISRDPSAHLHKKILFAATRVASLGVVSSDQGSTRQRCEGARSEGRAGARVWRVRRNNCARGFTTSNIIAHISPVVSSSLLLNARRCCRSTALAISSRRCGPWVKGTRSKCWARLSIHTRPASSTPRRRSFSAFRITATKER